MEKGASGNIALKRAYDHAAGEDRRRYLVERLWPRGVRKEALVVEAWLKDVAHLEHRTV